MKNLSKTCMKSFGLLLLFIGLLFSQASAQLLKVDQVVYGMDCAPCAYGMERSFKRMDGVKQVEVGLQKGIAHLTLEDDNQTTLQAIQQKVKNGGFTANKAEVVLKGKLVKAESDWEIQVNDETYQVTNDTDPNIRASLKAGKIKVRGLVPNEESEEPDKAWQMEVNELLT
jgi:cation transport ATPase